MTATDDFKIITLQANGGLRRVEWIFSAQLQACLTHNSESLSFRNLAHLMEEVPTLGWKVISVEDY